MPRRRLAVALLCPPDLAEAVDSWRRALRVPEPFHVPPHLTLVPPVNVRQGDVAAVLSGLRAAATAVAPFALRVGPGATFSPDSPTVHLAVGPHPALADLRDRVRRPPLERADTWPFTPHVTIAESHGADGIAGAVATLAGVDVAWPVDEVALLAQHRRDDGSRVWVPVRAEPLGGPAVVGRGGVEVVLRTVGTVEAGAAELAGTSPTAPVRHPDGSVPLAVVAEAAGGPVAVQAVAVGRVGGGTAGLDALVVVPEVRGEGRAAHLLAAFLAAAAARGAHLVWAAPGSAEAEGFLARHGFAPVGDRWVRAC